MGYGAYGIGQDQTNRLLIIYFVYCLATLDSLVGPWSQDTTCRPVKALTVYIII